MRDHFLFLNAASCLCAGLVFTAPLHAGEMPGEAPASVLATDWATADPDGELVPVSEFTGDASGRGGLFGTGILDPQGQWMFGDWGGRREALLEDGLTLHFGYTSEFAANFSGGDRRSTAYADQWVFMSTLDTEKAGWWDNGTFRLTWTNRNGTEIGRRAGLGTDQQPQEVYGRGSYLRLTQLWYEHRFGEVVWLKGGLMAMGEDFFSVPADFQNLTFIASLMGNIAGDYIFNWPVSQWGARAKFNPEGLWSLHIAVYEANHRYVDSEWVSKKGWYPNVPGGASGVLVPVELSFQPEINGHPGRYFVGVWGSTDPGEDPVYDVNGGLRLLTGAPGKIHHTRHGFYFGLSQYVYGRPEEPLNARVFFRFVQADHQTSRDDRQFSLGMIVNGLFGRPRDSIGVAIGTTHLNDHLRRAAEVYNAATGSDIPERTSEYVAEVFYSWSPTPWLRIQPNLQYIHHPGGTTQNSDVFLFGLKTSMNF